MQDPVGDSVLGVVVVNFGSHRLLEKNLVTAGLAGASVKVVVVDNFSDAAEREAVEALADQHGWAWRGLSSNVGFGAGVNVGLDMAAELGCRAFLILNPDARVTEHVVTELHRHLLREPTALITPRLLTGAGVAAFDGSQVFLDTGRIKRRRPAAGVTGAETLPPRGRQDGREVCAWLPGTCLAIHADLLERVGGFDEEFFLYWEDVDLSVRCAEAGGALVIRHDLDVVHDEGGTQNRRDDRTFSSHYYYWNTRNRLLFAARHLSTRQLLGWIAVTPSESWQILLRGGRRQLLRSWAPLRATVRGSSAGIVVAVRAILARRRRRSGS